VRNPALKSLEGKSIAQIGQSRARTASMPSPNLVGGLADNLECELTMASVEHPRGSHARAFEHKAILRRWRRRGAMSTCCAHALPDLSAGTWVRDKQAITLEEGVRKLTSESGRSVRPKRSRRLAKGARPTWRSSIPPRSARTITRARYDLPGAAKRIVMPSRGVI